MTRSELIANVCKNTGTAESVVKAVVDSYEQELLQGVVRDGVVKLQGLGRFKLVKRRPRGVCGEDETVYLAFRCAEGLKDQLRDLVRVGAHRPSPRLLRALLEHRAARVAEEAGG